MFKFEEYAHLLNSKNADERLIGEYWYTKQKYRNLLRFIGEDGIDFVQATSLANLSARLNDIRITAALNGIRLGAVMQGQKRETEAEKIKQEAFKAMDEAVHKFFNVELVKEGKK